MPNFRRILIIKPSSMGDVVHALPTLSALSAELGTPLKDRNHANFRLHVGLPDRDEVAFLLRRHGVSERVPWIAMNVSARWPTKRWPPEFFAAAADRIQEEKLGTVVLI